MNFFLIFQFRFKICGIRETASVPISERFYQTGGKSADLNQRIIYTIKPYRLKIFRVENLDSKIIIKLTRKILSFPVQSVSRQPHTRLLCNLLLDSILSQQGPCQRHYWATSICLCAGPSKSFYVFLVFFIRIYVRQ